MHLRVVRPHTAARSPYATRQVVKGRNPVQLNKSPDPDKQEVNDDERVAPPRMSSIAFFLRLREQFCRAVKGYPAKYLPVSGQWLICRGDREGLL